jgi:hypothetical protein
MGDLSDFGRGKIIGGSSAGASLTKTTTLLGVMRATVSKVMPAYTNHGKKTLGKRKSGLKSTMPERDRHTLRRIVSKNHRTTAEQVTTELNIHPEDRVFTKTVQRELHRSNMQGRAPTAKLLVTESNAQMCK